MSRHVCTLQSMKAAIDHRLDERCFHSPVLDGEGQYRCQKCGLCVAPAAKQVTNAASVRTVNDLWELVEPKHDAPLQTTWHELETRCVGEDTAERQHRAEALKSRGRIPKPRRETRTDWFDRRWPAELKPTSATIFVRDDEKGTYKLAGATYDHAPDKEIGGLFGRTDKRLQQAIAQGSADVVELFYEKAGLTQIERKIFGLSSRGYSQAVIGKQLHVSQQAVGKALARIRTKVEEFVAENGGEEFLDAIFDRHERRDDDD